VLTAELSEVLQPHKDAHEKRHPSRTGQLGFVRWASHESGVGYALVDSILRQRRPQCSLHAADALLAAVGETSALVDGRIGVLRRQYRGPPT
jgi:hypothetical protein